MSRIYGEKVDIRDSDIKEFFDSRAKVAQTLSPINSVLFQDNNPELAIERDLYEKSFIKPKLNIKKGSRILDVACGVGRWLDGLENEQIYYHGIDFSDSLIDLANNQFKDIMNSKFTVLSCVDLGLSVLKEKPFDIIICTGIFIYLNDNDFLETLLNIVKCASKDALIYIREPISSDERLVLKDFYSKELSSTYNAIYRNKEEMYAAIDGVLIHNGFGIDEEGALYKESEYNNRKETYQYYYILTR